MIQLLEKKTTFLASTEEEAELIRKLDGNQSVMDAISGKSIIVFDKVVAVLSSNTYYSEPFKAWALDVTYLYQESMFKSIF